MYCKTLHLNLDPLSQLRSVRQPNMNTGCSPESWVTTRLIFLSMEWHSRHFGIFMGSLRYTLDSPYFVLVHMICIL